MAKTISLLTYVDRLAGDLPSLTRLLTERMPQLNGVHLLPFFTPYDGVDAGFDPVDHATVDPRLGTWADVAELARHVAVTADLIVNHASAESPEFLDWLAHGDASGYAGMFLTYDTVFPDGAAEADITRFYRPRPGLPFTPYQQADGTKRLVWTTFEPTQVDLDVTSPAATAYLDRILQAMSDAGLVTVRLDAIGYAVKTRSGDSFMAPETLAYVADLVRRCHDKRLEVLVEVHSHYADVLDIAGRVDLTYDFVLPPLLLDALRTGSFDTVGRWLAVRPPNSVSVLDTHDGIGVVDASRKDEQTPGFLSEDDADAVFAEADRRTEGRSGRASVVPQFAPRPHQVNATFLDVLGGRAEALVALRAVQLFLPGPAHVYYVGLLGRGDDWERYVATGVGREINRHVFTAAEVDAALASDVTRAQLGLARLVTTHPAFDGDLTWTAAGGTLRLAWAAGDARCSAEVTVAGDDVALVVDDGRRTYRTAADLATLA